jgi:Transposase domain (DUF772)
VIEAKRLQRSFGDGLIAEEIEELQETWMRHVDVVLQDEGIISAVYGALAKRCPHSRSRGRPGYPAEVVLRLLILKHVRNWSYAVLEREVRANLVYRDFTREILRIHVEIRVAAGWRRERHGNREVRWRRRCACELFLD